jgi:hypothetical protein
VDRHARPYLRLSDTMPGAARGIALSTLSHEGRRGARYTFMLASANVPSSLCWRAH